jgi:DNA (cytosine-5)-methyltransferase 1
VCFYDYLGSHGGGVETGVSPTLKKKDGVATSAPVVRRLTPVECCRLQGFPGDWNIWGIGKDGKRVEMADSSRYKQLGNAVTVNVVQRIARRVVAATSSAPAPSSQADQ